MWSKETQEQSLEAYFSGLMAGAGEALWGEGALADPQPSTKKRGESRAAQKGKAVEPARPKSFLPARDAAYVHVRPLLVVGLKLALPQAAVREVREFPSAAAQGNATAPWIDGAYADAPALRIIDTARAVVPSSHPRYEEFVARKAYKHVVVLNGGQWGLACDVVDEDIIVPGAALCWRDTPGQDHPWLAATVRDFGYALVDVERMVDRLG